MTVEFVRHPNNAGLNETTGKESFFQSTLATIGFECYLTIDVNSKGSGCTQLYTRKQSMDSGEELTWHNSD